MDETMHGDNCEAGCCDPANQPTYFNKYTLVGGALLAGLVGIVALVQSLVG